MTSNRVLKSRSHNRTPSGSDPWWSPPLTQPPSIHWDLLSEALPLLPGHCRFVTTECSTCSCYIPHGAPFARFAHPTPRLQHVCEHCARSLALAIDAGDLPAGHAF